jgi:hypothetical protein
LSVLVNVSRNSTGLLYLNHQEQIVIILLHFSCTTVYENKSPDFW